VKRHEPCQAITDKALAFELDRLDRLAETHWAGAMAGDIEAAEAWLAIIDQKILLLASDRTGVRH
jgi:hypothetical protein